MYFICLPDETLVTTNEVIEENGEYFTILRPDKMQKFYINDTEFLLFNRNMGDGHIWEHISMNYNYGIMINCPDCSENPLEIYFNDNQEVCFICLNCENMYYIADTEGKLLTLTYKDYENSGDGSQYFLQKAGEKLTTFTINGVEKTVDEGTTWEAMLITGRIECPVCDESGGTLECYSSIVCCECNEQFVLYDASDNEIYLDSKIEDEDYFLKRLIPFTVNDHEYSVPEGTTWLQWAKNRYLECTYCETRLRADAECPLTLYCSECDDWLYLYEGTVSNLVYSEYIEEGDYQY